MNVLRKIFLLNIWTSFSLVKQLHTGYSSVYSFVRSIDCRSSVTETHFLIRLKWETNYKQNLKGDGRCISRSREYCREFMSTCQQSEAQIDGRPNIMLSGGARSLPCSSSSSSQLADYTGRLVVLTLVNETSSKQHGDQCQQTWQHTCRIALFSISVIDNRSQSVNEYSLQNSVFFPCSCWNYRFNILTQRRNAVQPPEVRRLLLR